MRGDLLLIMPNDKNGKKYNSYDLTAHVAIVTEDGKNYTDKEGWHFTVVERGNGNVVKTASRYSKMTVDGAHYIQMFVTPNYKIPDRWAPTGGSISIYSSDYKVGHEVKITPNAENVLNFSLSIRDASNSSNILFSKTDFTGSVSFYPEYNGKYLVWVDAVSSTNGHLGLESSFTIKESGGFSGDAPVVQECNHQWENVSVETPATVSSEGTMLQKCSKCGKTQTVAIPKLEPASTGNVLNVVINGKNKIAVGAKLQFDASVTVSGDADKSVGWRSEDKSIASVSETGMVTGIKPGKTVIYAKSSDGNIEASQIIYVIPKKNSSFKAYLGGTKQIDTYWEKQDGVSGYQIQYSTSLSFSSKKSKTLDGSCRDSSRRSVFLGFQYQPAESGV